MDEECVVLCDAINKLPGITTVESCCGHNISPFHIWFMAEELKDLPGLLYWFDKCHCGFYDWRIFVLTDCVMSPARFCIEGPRGAYSEADKIAELIEEALEGS